MFTQQAAVGGPVMAYGLGSTDAPTMQPIAAGSPSGSPSMHGAPFFSGLNAPGFATSAELGLLIAIGLVLYIDGRILPRRRG